jgi:hypothetical protein
MGTMIRKLLYRFGILKPLPLSPAMQRFIADAKYTMATADVLEKLIDARPLPDMTGKPFSW